MKIIREIKFNGTDAIKLFSSEAEPRRNNLRIHYHSLIEISVIVSGSGRYKIKNSVYTIGKGDVFFFRPNEAHCITDVEEDGMNLLNLHIAPSYLYSNFPNAFNTNFIKILAASFPLSSNKINDTLPPERVREIKDMFFSIKKEFENCESDYQTFANNYISTILILISRAYKITNFSKKEKQSYRKLLIATSYIDAHYKESITLDELADKVAYSRCYFSSVFKKCMGMSVWDYICIKRIEEALALIKTTDMNILDIALECGFNNAANFNKIFKKYTNVSPGRFRK